MLARQPRLRQTERHAILQLIAEAVGPAGLGKNPSAPIGGKLASDKEASGYEQNIHGAVGRAHLYRPQGVIPESGHLSENRVEVCCAIAFDQCYRFRRGCRLAQEKCDFDFCVRRDIDQGLQNAARIETGADTSGQRLTIGKRGGQS